jgi:hypothetical protein
LDFQIKKLSDVGTSNPIVARLSIQTSQLIQPFPLSDKQKEDIFGILGMDVRDRLLNCYKIYAKLHEELIKVNEIKIEDCFQRNAIHVPSIIGLRHMCESFLYQAKSTLRDLIGIFKIFYNKTFLDARFDQAVNWSREKFGKDDDLYKLLEQDNKTWIKKIVFMRNVVEHPNGNSGKLIVNDIKLINKERPPYFKAPTWHLEKDVESPILSDMATFINNTLEFSEDLLVILLKKLPSDLPLVFVEIPVEQRDKDCPIRLQVSLHSDLLKQLET